jgi:hypothetical protein
MIVEASSTAPPIGARRRGGSCRGRHSRGGRRPEISGRRRGCGRRRRESITVTFLAIWLFLTSWPKSPVLAPENRQIAGLAASGGCCCCSARPRCGEPRAALHSCCVCRVRYGMVTGIDPGTGGRGGDSPCQCRGCRRQRRTGGGGAGEPPTMGSFKNNEGSKWK